MVGRARRPLPVVILTPGWSGERVLVRLLSECGAFRSSGYWLGVARPRPESDLRALLRSRTNEAVHAVLIQPAHLWAVNNLDLHESVARLADDGISLMSLERRAPLDSGISRSLCGLDGEVLPAAPRALDPVDVMVHAANARDIATWLDEVMPPASPRLVFEDDLVDPCSRAATSTRLSAFLGLDLWPPSPDPDPPHADRLWDLVTNREAVQHALASMMSSAGER